MVTAWCDITDGNVTYPEMIGEIMVGVLYSQYRSSILHYAAREGPPRKVPDISSDIGSIWTPFAV
jgi:hypothetical protein